MQTPLQKTFMNIISRRDWRCGKAATVALFLAWSDVSLAQARPEPPDLLAFEGSVVGTNGAPIGASGAVNFPMVFRIYDRPVGGTLVWSEQQTVPVFQGAFSVLLGEGSAFANEPRPPLSSIFATATASGRFVEVTARGSGPGGADASLSPRTRLLGGAYGFLATHARTAQDMVNRDGQPILTPVGNRVGVNRTNPSATMDVAGSMASKGVALSEGITNGGGVDAGGYFGLGMAPVGSIVMWTGTTPPRGWVLCDGSTVAGVATPDLRGRFVLGAGHGSGLTPRTLGDRGGAEAHALVVEEIPSHSHFATFSGELDGVSAGSHTYRVAAGSNLSPIMGWPWGGVLSSTFAGVATSVEGAHAHAVQVPSFASSHSGSGRPHNNMPPFYVLAFVMRVQ